MGGRENVSRRDALKLGGLTFAGIAGASLFGCSTGAVASRACKASEGLVELAKSEGAELADGQPGSIAGVCHTVAMQVYSRLIRLPATA